MGGASGRMAGKQFTVYRVPGGEGITHFTAMHAATHCAT